MKPDTIQGLLVARAATMAAHDGVPAGAVHIHGAANQLQVELLSARDALLPPPKGVKGGAALSEVVAESAQREAPPAKSPSGKSSKADKADPPAASDEVAADAPPPAALPEEAAADAAAPGEAVQ
jgi:hypothetical protein